MGRVWQVPGVGEKKDGQALFNLHTAPVTPQPSR